MGFPSLPLETVDDFLASVTAAPRHEQMSAPPRSDGVIGDFASLCKFTPWKAEDYEELALLKDAIHGKVYKYMYRPTGEVIVIKKMPNHRVEMQDCMESAMAEIRVSKHLSEQSHENPGSIKSIAAFRGAYKDEEYMYFETEFCDGGELFDQVAGTGRFDEADVQRLGRQVLEAIASMHRHGVVHRDISLENVLLHDGQALVIDFGQAVPVWDANKKGKTVMRHTGRAGKDYYRSPELYLKDANRQNIPYEGPPVDKFALGVMLFIMVMGTAPWNMAHKTDPKYRYVNIKGLESLVAAWSGHVQMMSPSMLDIVSKLLSIDPKDRPTAEEALKHPWFQGLHATSAAFAAKGI